MVLDLQPEVSGVTVSDVAHVLATDPTSPVTATLTIAGALLGGEVIGADAGEIIHLLSLAPDRDTALKWLASGTYNHPARAEELRHAEDEGVVIREQVAPVEFLGDDEVAVA